MVMQGRKTIKRFLSLTSPNLSQEVITALRLQRESPQEALSVLAKDIQESCPDCQMTVLEGDPVEQVTALARSLKRRPERHRQPPSSRIPGPLVCSGQ
jgi:hypothetical protein